MHFFTHFPVINYQFDNEEKKVTNILSAFFYRRMAFQKTLFFQQYTIKDEDIPESLSNTIYKSPLYYWSFLTLNNAIDPYTDWVMPGDTLDSFVEKKYRVGRIIKKKTGNEILPLSSGKYGIHHFYNINTERVCDDIDDEYYRMKYQEDPLSIGQNIIPVTNIAYEKEDNFKRRTITIVNPRMILKFEDDFKKMLKGD